MLLIETVLRYLVLNSLINAQMMVNAEETLLNVLHQRSVQLVISNAQTLLALEV